MLTPIDAGMPAGVRGLVTTRAGGTSLGAYRGLNLGDHVGDDPDRVTHNRAALSAVLGGGPVRFVRQVHGVGVRVVGPTDDDARPASADIVLTAAPGVPVAVVVADCLPVLLADPVAGVVAAVHAGRPGLAAGVLPVAIQAMRRLGADPGRMAAVVGPGICGRCYEVPASMRDEVARTLPGSATTTRAGTPGLDLPAGALRAIADAGIGSIRRLPGCTVEDEHLYSYRRDGVTGRFAGVVMIEG